MSQNNNSNKKTIMMSLDDIQDFNASQFGDKPLNILVTTHEIKPYFTDVKEKGLGLWINYILSEYLTRKNIPHKLFLKALGDDVPTSQVIDFITHNDIDIIIPSDVTDTFYLAKNHEELSKYAQFAVTDDVSVYEKLENKWDTFQMMECLGIFTPETEVFDPTSEEIVDSEDQQYPFFLKIASGTNGGRGVWHIKNGDDLKDAIDEINIDESTLLIKQKPVEGDIICGQAVFDHSVPKGFFFSKSVQADDLAGVSNKYMQSQNSNIKDQVSHVKVELTDSQWEELHNIFTTIGKATNYHGMIDIEFIVSPTDGICLLECNPRFSGALHTSLSNIGFLDLYFNVLLDQPSMYDDTSLCGNYSAGVEMKARFGDFYTAQYYANNLQKVLLLRNWNVILPPSHNKAVSDVKEMIPSPKSVKEMIPSAKDLVSMTKNVMTKVPSPTEVISKVPFPNRKSE